MICQVHTNVFVPVKTVPISDATVVVLGVLCLGGPCAGLHRSRLVQSAPVGDLSNALIVSKALHLSARILPAQGQASRFELRMDLCTIDVWKYDRQRCVRSMSSSK